MSAIAKRCSQLLGLAPGDSLAVSVLDEGFDGAVRSLCASAGVALPEAGPADKALVELAVAPGPTVAPRLREVIERVAPAGAVVVWLREAADVHPNALAARIGPMLDLEGVVVEAPPAGDGALLKGVRRKALDQKKIKRLRGMGHEVDASVLIGRGGITEETVAAAREAVERHGLIKVKLTPQCELDKTQAAVEIAWATGSKLIQRIGRTALLYRPDVKLDPPVSRRRR